jgi:hypothetical protein
VHMVRHYYRGMQIIANAMVVKTVFKNQISCGRWKNEIIPRLKSYKVRTVVFLYMWKVAAIHLFLNTAEGGCATLSSCSSQPLLS